MTRLAARDARSEVLSRFARRATHIERQGLRKGYETAVSNAEKDVAMGAIIAHLEKNEIEATLSVVF